MLNSASIMDGVWGTTLHKAALRPRCSKCPYGPQCTLPPKGTVTVTLLVGWTDSQPTALFTNKALSLTPYPGIEPWAAVEILWQWTHHSRPARKSWSVIAFQ